MALRSVDASAIEGRFGKSLSQGPFQVHSVYDNSVNIGCAGPFGLLVVLNPTGDVAPASLVLASEVPFQDIGIGRGCPVFIGQRRVLLGELEIRLGAARRIDRAVADAASARTSCDDGSNGQKKMAEAINGATSVFRGPFDPRVSARLSAGSDLMEDALLGGTGLDEAVSNLVGLGYGLTPSGDDYLTGLCAALSTLRGRQDPLVSDFRSAILRHAGKTTDVGAWMLRYAADGGFRTSLTDVVDSYASGLCDEGKLKALWKIGASSGFDMSTGVLSGLRVCEILRRR